jgi:large subunit ribosomal protein L21
MFQIGQKLVFNAQQEKIETPQKILPFNCDKTSFSPYFCRPNNGKIMLAVVKIAGQQFKVTEGQSLYVPHIAGNAGDKVEFSDVLMVDNNGSLTVGGDVKATVKAEIVSSLVQGEKVIAFKMKRRKGFRKKHGHRTHYTRIKVVSIA